MRQVSYYFLTQSMYFVMQSNGLRKCALAARRGGAPMPVVSA
jgi:hypothetical protein